jgi:DNA-binding transcriptional LysR family regulator
MQLGSRSALPLALFPPHCDWRRLALAKLDEAGRDWTLVLQSAGMAGILAAVEAGLAVSVFARGGLPKSLKTLGSAEGLAPLPDFEYVLRRRAKVSTAVQTLADVIVNYFQLSAALRGDAGHKHVERGA